MNNIEKACMWTYLTIIIKDEVMNWRSGRHRWGCLGRRMMQILSVEFSKE